MKLLNCFTVLGSLVAGRYSEGSIEDTAPLVVLYYENWAGWVRDFSPSHVEKNFLSRELPVRNFVMNYAFYTWNYEECSLIPVDTIDLQAGDKGGWTKADWNIESQEEWETKNPAGGHLPAFMMLKSRYPHIKLLPSIGGWSRSHTFHDCISTKMDHMIDSVMDHMIVWGWDGIDLDWEYPNCDGKACGCQDEKVCTTASGFSNKAAAGDWDLYIQFVKRVRARFNDLEDQLGRRLYITAALGMHPNLIDGHNDQWSTPTPIEWMCNEDDMDWVNLMTYDFYGPWAPVTGPLAPMYSNPASSEFQMSIDDSLSRILARCSRPEKLTMGLATYGKAWQGVPKQGSVPGLWQKSTAVDYRGGGTWETGTLAHFDIKKNILDKCTRTWDAVSQTPTLYCATLPSASPALPDANPSPARNQPNTFISYEDAESWKIKMQYAKSKGMAGAMIWAASDTGNGAPYAPESAADLLEGLFEGWFGKKVPVGAPVERSAPGTIKRWEEYPCPHVIGYPSTGTNTLDTSRCSGNTYTPGKTYLQLPAGDIVSDLGKDKKLIVKINDNGSSGVPPYTPTYTTPPVRPTPPLPTRPAPTQPWTAPRTTQQRVTQPAWTTRATPRATTTTTTTRRAPPAPTRPTPAAGASAKDECRSMITSAPYWLSSCQDLCDYYNNSPWCPAAKTGAELAQCVARQAAYCSVQK